MSNESFKIEKGIPIPKSNKGRTSKYPFRNLKVGDSFFVKDGEHKITAVTPWNKITGFTFTLRKVEGGIRIWRTK